MRKFTIFLALGLVLQACKTTTNDLPRADAVNYLPILLDTAEKVQKRLSAIEKFSHSSEAAEMDRVGVAPAELERVIDSYSYYGDAVVVVRDLAKEAGYKFRVLGNVPSAPLLIVVDWKTIRLIDGIRDVGARVGRRAVVSVDTNEAKVEFLYAR